MSCAEKIDVICFNQNRLQKYTKKICKNLTQSNEYKDSFKHLC